MSNCCRELKLGNCAGVGLLLCLEYNYGSLVDSVGVLVLITASTSSIDLLLNS